VLRLLVKGDSNSEIGQTLGIALSTVKKHVSSIFQKLHTDSRTEVAFIAIRYKWVEL
jgi:DNA-binding NarL/FixJ family response regulator